MCRFKFFLLYDWWQPQFLRCKASLTERVTRTALALMPVCRTMQIDRERSRTEHAMSPVPKISCKSYCTPAGQTFWRVKFWWPFFSRHRFYFHLLPLLCHFFISFLKIPMTFFCSSSSFSCAASELTFPYIHVSRRCPPPLTKSYCTLHKILLQTLCSITHYFRPWNVTVHCESTQIASVSARIREQYQDSSQGRPWWPSPAADLKLVRSIASFKKTPEECFLFRVTYWHLIST